MEFEPTMPRENAPALTGTPAAGVSTDWEQKLRAVLAGTHEQEPRPLARFDLPLQLGELIKPEWLASLKRAAVLVPVVLREDQPTVLLTQRSELLRSHRGQVAFPGGRRDAGDRSAAENALREAEEEIGLPRSEVEVIGYLDDYPTSSLYRVTPVVGLVRELPALRLDAAEVATVFEVPLALLLDPQRYVQKSLLRDNLRLPFYEVLYDDYRIWGATAGMLWTLCRRFHP